MKDTNEFKLLLDNNIINEETQNQIQEAFDTRLNEAREDVRAELREEFAKKYDHDIKEMVASLDKMSEEKLTEALSKIEDERKKLEEDRVKFNVKMAEQGTKIKNFTVTKLGEELKEFNEDRKKNNEIFEQERLALRKDKVKSKAKVSEDRKKIQNFVFKQLGEEIKEFSEDRKIYNENFEKLKMFVSEVLSEEITEIHQDKMKIVEDRVRMVAEGKKELARQKREFVEKNSKLVKKLVTEGLAEEMKPLLNDIEYAKQNDFGRRIFETYAAEFAVSHLNENEDVKDMQIQLETVTKQLEEAKRHINQKSAIVESKEAEIRRINNRTERNTKLEKMLKPLSDEQKTVMENLLKDVRISDQLDEAFQKYLPAVLKNSEVKNGPSVQQLTEIKEVTGNKKVARNADYDNDVVEMKRMAGITN